MVVAIEVASPVVTRDLLRACAQPLLVVDLGVPRAVASDVGDLTNVVRIDIGDLRERVERALDDRHEAADQALEIVNADVERFLADQRAQQLELRPCNAAHVAGDSPLRPRENRLDQIKGRHLNGNYVFDSLYLRFPQNNP